MGISSTSNTVKIDPSNNTVNVNLISGFATETTLNTIEDQISKLTFSTNEDSLIISGNVGVAGSVGIDNWDEANIAVDISGQYVNIGNWDDANISVDISGSTVIAKVQGYDGTTYNNLFVDANGFLTTDFVETHHQDINFGFDAVASNMTTDGAGSAWSKTNPISTTDDGWYLEGNGLSTLLWYNNGNYQSTVFPIQSNFTFADIDIWFMILKNYFPFNTTTQIMPEIYIYSKATGTGDFISGLCHSVWYYTCNSNQMINYGESIMIYTGQTARVKKINPELRRIPYSNTAGGGDRANTEVINHIEFRFNTANTYKILVQEGGIYVKNKGLLNYYFTTDNETNADIATIAMKTATDTINTSTSAINTKLTGMTYQTNRLQTVSTLVDAGGDVATISTPLVLSGTTTIRGLDSQSYVNAYDVYNNVYNNLTMVTDQQQSTLYKALDVYARNPNTQVVNYGQTEENGKSGLNIYQIYPKKIHYFLYGQNATNTASMILGGTGCGVVITSYAFGKVNARQYTVVAAVGSAVPRTLKYHYVDSDGVLQTNGSVLMSATNTVYSLGTNIISINKHWQEGSLGTNDAYLIRIGSFNTPLNTVGSADVDDYYNGILTVPNGYIGYLTNFNALSPTATFFSVVKWDENGNRYITWSANNVSTSSQQSGHNGSLGGIFTAGESIAIVRNAALASSVGGGMFILEPI